MTIFFGPDVPKPETPREAEMVRIAVSAERVKMAIYLCRQASTLPTMPPAVKATPEETLHWCIIASAARVLAGADNGIVESMDLNEIRTHLQAMARMIEVMGLGTVLQVGFPPSPDTPKPKPDPNAN